MIDEQYGAPLLEALVKYKEASPVRFHVPGHTGGRAAPGEMVSFTGPGVFEADATELPGLDDLNSPQGVIARAQELAARAFGADSSLFLVNGSTIGLQALVMAAGPPGGKVIVPRNCHRSVVGALVLAGLEAVFTCPVIVPGFNFAAGVPAGEVAGALEEHPDARAVLCIHPTYCGTVGDTRSISGLTRARGIPLLADEAHGPHLYFHPGYPAGALQSGADAAVQSMHKTGGSLTQSALLHLRGNLMDRQRVVDAVKLLQTSSPSYILMASLDAARRQLAVRGRELLQGVLEAAAELKSRLTAVRGLEVLGAGSLDGDGVFDCDPSRVVVRVSGMGMTGYRAAELLADRYRIYIEMADRDNIVLVLGLGVTREDCRLLAVALVDLSEREGGPALPPASPGLPAARPVVNIREAWHSPSRPVRMGEAAGLVCGEWVAVYPPGIPALIPGEEVSHDMVNYLAGARSAGARFQGPADPELNWIRVMDC